MGDNQVVQPTEITSDRAKSLEMQTTSTSIEEAVSHFQDVLVAAELPGQIQVSIFQESFTGQFDDADAYNAFIADAIALEELAFSKSYGGRAEGGKYFHETAASEGTGGNNEPAMFRGLSLERGERSPISHIALYSKEGTLLYYFSVFTTGFGDKKFLFKEEYDEDGFNPEKYGKEKSNIIVSKLVGHPENGNILADLNFPQTLLLGLVLSHIALQTSGSTVEAMSQADTVRLFKKRAADYLGEGAEMMRAKPLSNSEISGIYGDESEVSPVYHTLMWVPGDPEAPVIGWKNMAERLSSLRARRP